MEIIQENLLATQVLSQSIVIALEESDDDGVLGTAKFCRMMDSFFDCTNERSRADIHKKNEFINVKLCSYVTYVLATH